MAEETKKLPDWYQPDSRDELCPGANVDLGSHGIVRLVDPPASELSAYQVSAEALAGKKGDAVAAKLHLARMFATWCAGDGVVFPKQHDVKAWNAKLSSLPSKVALRLERGLSLFQSSAGAEEFDDLGNASMGGADISSGASQSPVDIEASEPPSD